MLVDFNDPIERVLYFEEGESPSLPQFNALETDGDPRHSCCYDCHSKRIESRYNKKTKNQGVWCMACNTFTKKGSIKPAGPSVSATRNSGRSRPPVSDIHLTIKKPRVTSECRDWILWGHGSSFGPVDQQNLKLRIAGPSQSDFKKYDRELMDLQDEKEYKTKKGFSFNPPEMRQAIIVESETMLISITKNILNGIAGADPKLFASSVKSAGSPNALELIACLLVSRRRVNRTAIEVCEIAKLSGVDQRKFYDFRPLDRLRNRITQTINGYEHGVQ